MDRREHGSEGDSTVQRAVDLVKHLKLSYNLSLLEESNLPPEIYDHSKLEGMSSPKVRHFLNNLGSLPGIKYLEIGTYKGSTLISAVHGNEGDFFAIDNFAWGFRDEFLHNLSKHGVRDKIKFFDIDSWELDPAQIDKKINVYFYDGDHSTKAQAQALTHFRNALADEFIFIVDDWRDRGDDRQSGAMSGTWQGIHDADLKVIYESEAPRSGRLPEGIKGEGYHMGLGLFVLRKKESRENMIQHYIDRINQALSRSQSDNTHIDAQDVTNEHGKNYYRGVESMNQPDYWRIINDLCSHPGVVHTHVGFWKGASLFAALAGNDNVKVYGIDSFFGGKEPQTKEEFLSHVERLSVEDKFVLIEDDCFSFDLSQIKEKVNFHLYDAGHEYEEQYNGILYYAPVLADVCIIMVDNFKSDNVNVEEATDKAIEDMGYEIRHKRINTTHCHQGYYVIEKRGS